MSTSHSDFDTSLSSASCDLSLNSERLVDICEEFSNRLQAGDGVSISEYTSQYPDIADQIEESLNALQRLTHSVSAPELPADPTMIAGCRILRQIGAGAMGTVYEALHPRLSRRLAIKVLSSAVGVSNSSERFLQEAEVGSRLTHAHIVPFVDYGIEDGRTYLSMHYIDGLSLDSMLESSIALRKKFRSLDGLQEADPLDATVGFETLVIAHDFQKIAAIGADIADALDYAHQMKVIHRDIKPGNLILDRQGKIWVADFGLAKAQIDEANIVVSTGMVGTPRYMAPEQIRGVCSHQSDIYSLGVTLYELASGQRAWDSVSRTELLKARTGLELPCLSEVAPHVPAELAKIIMKACALRPIDRYPTAAELANVLARFAKTGQVGDRRKPDRQEGQKYLRRKPIWLAAGICSVAAAFGWSVLFQPKQLPTEPEDLLAALESEDILGRIFSALPETEGGDTAEARETREKLADSFVVLAEKFLLRDGDSEHDREQLKEVYRKFADGYVSGDYTQEQVLDSQGPASREFFVSLQLTRLQGELLESDLSFEAKGKMVVMFNALHEQLASDVEAHAIANKLRDLLPGTYEKLGPEDWPRLKGIFSQIQELVGENNR